MSKHYINWVWIVCCTLLLFSGWVAVHISYTGKISICLSATVSMYCRSQCLAKTLRNTWLHNDTSMRVFFSMKQASFSESYNFWKWYSLDAHRNLWVQNHTNHYLLRYYWRSYIISVTPQKLIRWTDTLLRKMTPGNIEPWGSVDDIFRQNGSTNLFSNNKRA